MEDELTLRELFEIYEAKLEKEYKQFKMSAAIQGIDVGGDEEESDGPKRSYHGKNVIRVGDAAKMQGEVNSRLGKVDQLFGYQGGDN